MAHRRFDIGATFALFGVLVFWAAVPIMLRYLTTFVPDGWTSNAIRYPIATLLYTPWLIRAARDRSKRRLWLLAVVPAIPNVFAQSCWAWAPYYIEPGLMSFIVRTSMIWAMLMAFMLFPDERRLMRSPRFWAGLMLSAAGFLGVVLGSHAIGTPLAIHGVLITLACSVFWGLYAVCARATIRNENPLTAFAVVGLYTSVGCVALAPLGDPSSVFRLSAGPMAILILSAATGIAAAHGLFFIAVKRLGATITSTMNILTPFLTAAGSAVLFREIITTSQWISGGVMLIGGALIVWSQEHVHAARAAQLAARTPAPTHDPRIG